MITNADIIKLAKVLATKEDIRDMREEMGEMKVSINSLTNNMDGLARKVENIALEQIAIKRHLKLV